MKNILVSCLLLTAIAMQSVTALADPKVDARALTIERAEAFRLRAEAGDVEAQCEYGFLLLEGVSVKKNSKQGLEWLKKAAKKGSTRAAKMLKRLEATARYKVFDTLSPGQSESPVVDTSPPVSDSETQGHIFNLKEYQRQAAQGLLPRPSIDEKRPCPPLADPVK